ncbi:uncharacterized protein K444DRAFT_186820 [Hyaloscypha bicolor E]|uniref:Heterokaryon incompatibility domain-containing protein n=1 Tax=Hyaloscypha bicolor E TaxID=1095630 RepID=A0A2J6SR01_9HELO|nr:uncharacterized protein K444DRAFT_186820 [Hyaloscypha bicolor E]PMD53208.1 hypothetical protein K444DRAFT_186820 [Hyaloscypha bicolor E]
MSFVDEPVDKWSIQAVDSLLMRSYWSRMWIIQEVVLAKVLESDRFIDDKSIYWRLTICKMTRYRRSEF